MQLTPPMLAIFAIATQAFLNIFLTILLPLTLGAWSARAAILAVCLSDKLSDDKTDHSKIPYRYYGAGVMTLQLAGGLLLRWPGCYWLHWSYMECVLASAVTICTIEAAVLFGFGTYYVVVSASDWATARIAGDAVWRSITASRATVQSSAPVNREAPPPPYPGRGLGSGNVQRGR